MDPKFFRKYSDILREFGADNGPIGVAGRQPAPAGTAPAAKPAPGQPAPAAPAAQPQQQGVSRFANTADAYDSGIDGPAGQRTTINTSTGQRQTSDASGTSTVDASGTPISHTTPNLGGYSQTTYTGSAGKGPASGAQTTNYSQGPLSVTRDTNAAGKQTSSSAEYDMGVAKATVTQQGDENAPLQTNMQTTQPAPVDEDGIPTISDPNPREQPHPADQALGALRTLRKLAGIDRGDIEGAVNQEVTNIVRSPQDPSSKNVSFINRFFGHNKD